jgi:hypothetical protein
MLNIKPKQERGNGPTGPQVLIRKKSIAFLLTSGRVSFVPFVYFARDSLLALATGAFCNDLEINIFLPQKLVYLGRCFLCKTNAFQKCNSQHLLSSGSYFRYVCPLEIWKDCIRL